jgi:hypothetical protein
MQALYKGSTLDSLTASVTWSQLALNQLRHQTQPLWEAVSLSTETQFCKIYKGQQRIWSQSPWCKIAQDKCIHQSLQPFMEPKDQET